MKDMTSGSPAGLLIRFAAPMLVGDLFLQLYNIVDTMVVARYVGKEALAAVGASFAVMGLINSIIMGLSLGASVLFSQLYGAKDLDRLKNAVGMAAVGILSLTAIISLLTTVFCPALLRLYRMPEETFGYGLDYLQCIFAGLIFMGLYAFSSNVLRALGDSRTPLVFLMISVFMNIGLDFWFVIGLRLEAFGAALATVLAQIFSGVFCTLVAWRKTRFLGFSRRDLRFDGALLRTMGGYAVFTSLQQSVMNLGGVLVNGLINTFGPTVMAAFAAASKIDAFAHLPSQDLGNALATYTAQNRGAGRQDRVWRGLRATAVITAALGLFTSLLVTGFAPGLIGLFAREGDLEVVEIGAAYLRTEGWFYVFIGFLAMFYGFYRGVGKAQMSVVLTVVSLGTRVLLSYAAAPFAGYQIIFWAIPIGWILADVTGALVLPRLRRSLTAEGQDLSSLRQ